MWARLQEVRASIHQEDLESPEMVGSQSCGRELAPGVCITFECVTGRSGSQEGVQIGWVGTEVAMSDLGSCIPRLPGLGVGSLWDVCCFLLR